MRIPSGGFVGVFAVCVVSSVAVVFCRQRQLSHSHTPIAGRVTGNQGGCEGIYSSSLRLSHWFVGKDSTAKNCPEEANSSIYGIPHAWRQGCTHSSKMIPDTSFATLKLTRKTHSIIQNSQHNCIIVHIAYTAVG